MPIAKHWNQRFKIVIHPDTKSNYKDLTKEILELFHDYEWENLSFNANFLQDKFYIVIAPIEADETLSLPEHNLGLLLSDRYKSLALNRYVVPADISLISIMISHYIDKIIENESLKFFEKSLESALALQEFFIDENIAYQNEAQEFECWLLDIYQFDELVNDSKEYFIQKNITIRITDNPWEEEGYNYLPITELSSQNIYFGYHLKTDMTLVKALYLKVLDWEKNNGPILKQKKNIDERMDILQYIEIPFVLLDKYGRRLLHNFFFTSLSISIPDVFLLKDGSYILRENKSYRVNRIEQDDSILIFFEAQVDYAYPAQTISSSELGVITSSLAHEINNPLGGILAGLSLLELDEWDEGELEIIRQMKTSSLRAKKLVETFLGFSRITSPVDSTSCNAIRESFTQALDLMRYRLVENNINFRHQFIKQNDLAIKVNEAMFTMGIYLVLGEILTSFNHQKLIDSSLPGQIEIKCVEDSTNIAIYYNVNLPLGPERLNSKLLGHILDLHQMILEPTPSGVVFRGDSLET